MDFNGILVLAYPGSGKTYLADHYNNVCDLEFQHYRWDYGQYQNLPLEKLKGRKDIRTNRPEWPNNFFELLDEKLNGGIVLVPMATSLFERLDYLRDVKNVRVIFAMPNRVRFEQLLDVYRQRGNDDKFIESRKNDFDKFHGICEKTKFEKVYIDENEHLYDALIKLGFHLERGKGYKNYF